MSILLTYLVMSGSISTLTVFWMWFRTHMFGSITLREPRSKIPHLRLIHLIKRS